MAMWLQVESDSPSPACILVFRGFIAAAKLLASSSAPCAAYTREAWAVRVPVHGRRVRQMTSTTAAPPQACVSRHRMLLVWLEDPMSTETGGARQGSLHAAVDSTLLAEEGKAHGQPAEQR